MDEVRAMIEEFRARRELVVDGLNAFASGFDKGALPLPPGRRFAILTCMDARLDPAKYAGLSEGDAHVIRNAGGRASDDAIRSLVISYKLLGTQEWFVIHHTNCGMEFFTDDLMGKLLEQSLETAELGPEGFRDIGDGPGSPEGRNVKWLTIANQEQSVVEDVTRIRTHPLVSSAHPDLWLPLQRHNRPPRRDPRRHRSRPARLTPTKAANPPQHDEKEGYSLRFDLLRDRIRMVVKRRSEARRSR